MTAIDKIWKQLPIMIRAIVTGLVVLLAGNLPGGILFGANLQLLPLLPWAIVPTTVYLWYYCRYLSGRGKFSSTSELRRHNFRSTSLSPQIWIWSLLSGMAGIGGLLFLSKAYVRFLGINVPSPLPDLSSYPSSTVIVLLVISSVVAGVAEETAFRGYMQKPIEERHGLITAILIVGLAFGLTHFTHAGMSMLLIPLFIAASAVYGVLAYVTNSLLPGMLLHALGNTIELIILWARGSSQGNITAAEGITDLPLLSVGALILLAAAVPAFMKLRSVVRQSQNLVTENPQNI